MHHFIFALASSLMTLFARQPDIAMGRPRPVRCVWSRINPTLHLLHACMPHGFLDWEKIGRACTAPHRSHFVTACVRACYMAGL